MRMQNVMLGYGMDHIIVVTYPTAITHVKHIGDIVAQLVISAVVIDHCKKLVDFLLLVVLVLRQVFY